MSTSKVIEFTQRSYDNKWVRWELMDSKQKGGIGDTATWSRFKWIITGVWDQKPTKLMDKFKDNFTKREKSSRGKLIYKYEF